MDDVVVAGGGPAGSTLALRLARAGASVRIVERARFPRRKVCGEYLNSGAVAALGDLGVLDIVRDAAAPLLGVRLVPAGNVPVTLPFTRPALACARERLDALLLEAAAAAGATVERARVEDVIDERGRCAGVRVRTEDGSVVERRARFTVGADGARSVIAKKLGLTVAPHGRARYAVGGHYRGFDALDAHVEMYVGDGAYFAINPLSDEIANVMVVVPKQRLERWSADVDGGVGGAAAALGRGLRSFAGVERSGPRAAVGPLAHRVRSTIAPGVLLAGDAAGFLDPFTGQGVYLALTSAAAAAAAVLAALHDPARERASLARYASEHRAEMRARARLCAIVKLLIDVPPLARRAASRLARSPELAEALVDALAGVVPPQRAFRPAVLGRLLA